MGYAACWGGMDGSVVSIKEGRSADHCWDDGQGGVITDGPLLIPAELVSFIPALLLAEFLQLQ